MRYIKNVKRALAMLLLLALVLTPTAYAKGENEKKNTVLLGGMAFGVSFQTGELKIGGFDDVETENGVCSPGKDGGLLENDIIKKVDGKEVTSAVDVTAAVKNSGGAVLTFNILRDNKELSVAVTPVVSKETGDWRLGIWLEDSTAGLGTVTYIEEKTGRFGGLGHGIVKSDTGKLCDFMKGIVSEVTITGVNKGKAGTPGELRGDFLADRLGVVTKNSDRGVFGYITEFPEDFEAREIELCKKDEIKSGGASVFSTVDGGGVCEYSVEITLIEDSEEKNKNFFITVRDTSLIEKTGGIVRGMSGSPVVQNGKLIGAVTHVLVDDPTKGYGIFIENMMELAD